MKKHLIAAVALAAAASCQAQETVPPTAEAGRKAYTSFCVRCHGINLAVSSSAYFDLRTFPADEKERFLHSVTNGKRQMPAWGGIVRPDQMEAIWAYIGSVNGWAAPAGTGAVASAAKADQASAESR